MEPVRSLLEYGVLGLSYLGLGLGYLPGLRMNRPTIALVGSALMIGLGTLSLQQAWVAIDASTITFLFSMMVVNAHLAFSGFFRLALTFLLRLTQSPLGLLLWLTGGSALLSAVFLNDTLALVFTPLTLEVALALGLNPIPYLLTLAAATNLGSLATINGNPQNILVGTFSGIAYMDFTAALLPVALAGLGVQVGLLWWLYPEVRSLRPVGARPDFGASTYKTRVYRPLLIKTLVITALLLLAFVLNFPLADSALMAAAALLITRRLKPQRVLRQVDWTLLLMFSGLFILTASTRQVGLLDPFVAFVDYPAGLLLLVAALSNLVSNVPAVLLLAPVIPAESDTAWLLLAAGSTLAGNLTLLGAVANLIVVEAANQEGYTLRFGEHLRFGLPLTLITLGITYFWLAGNGSY